MLGLPMDCMSKLLLSESKSIVQDTGCSLWNTCCKAVIQRFQCYTKVTVFLRSDLTTKFEFVREKCPRDLMSVSIYRLGIVTCDYVGGSSFVRML